MVGAKSYFDTHAHIHAYQKGPDFYGPSVIKKLTSPIRLLDLGCGNGSFINYLIKEGITGDYVGVDISTSMLTEASKHLRGQNVNLIIADGFALPFSTAAQFDFIHLDSVLHHLTGDTRSKSTNLAKNMLDIMFSKVSKNGIVLIEEMFYESYVIPSFTAAMIFYGLKVLNFLKIDLRKIAKDVVPGLEVNFFSEKELLHLLSRYGKPEIITKRESKSSKLQMLFLQKEFGHLSLLVRKED
jgi:SAM-dependent methyltransferase